EPRPEFDPEPEPEPEPGFDAEAEAEPEVPEVEYVPEPTADSEYWVLVRPEHAESGSREEKEAAAGLPGGAEQEYVPEPDDEPGPSLKERLPFYRRRARS
ncbi:hypothetical protein ACFQ07_12760, partial [Actinomadura adrarensis]